MVDIPSGCSFFVRQVCFGSKTGLLAWSHYGYFGVTISNQKTNGMNHGSAKIT